MLRRRWQLLTNSGELVVLVGSAAVNAASFFFHLLASRQLGPADYGALGALVGIMAVIAVPAAALQVAVTRDSHRSAVNIRPLLRNACLLGCLSAIALLVCAPVLEDALQLPGLTPAIVLGLFVFPITIELVPHGLLLGERRFRLVSTALVSGAVVRVALAFPLASTWGLNGAMLATLAGTLVTTAVMLPSLLRLLRADHTVVGAHASQAELAPKPLTPQAIGPALAFGGFWLLATADTLIARHYFPAEQSGFYAAASLIARSAMFVSAGVGILAFPRFAQGAGRTVAARRTLVKAIAVVTITGTLVAAVLTLLPTLVIGAAFSPEFEDAAAPLGLLAFSATAMAIVSVLVNFHLALRSRYGAGLVWLGVAAIVSFGVWTHDSMQQLALITLLVNVALVMIMAWPIFGPAARRTVPRYSSRELWELPDADREVTLVVPFFNPGDLLASNIERVISVMDASGASYEIIAVSDGSTDKSEAGLAQFGEAVRLVRLPQNQGKGAALRTGLAMARGKYVGFIDADGDVAADSLREFVTLVQLYEPDVILGSKRHPMSKVSYPIVRRVYSWGYQQLVRLLFRLNLRDTQTGFKLVRREALAEILPRMIEKRFAFDLELFVVGRHLGYERFFEAPVHITHQFTSTVSLKAVRGTLLDTLAIFYRLHFLRFYDTPAVNQESMSGPFSPG